MALDIRRGSPTFGKWVECTLSQENALQFYIPPSFAYGFVATSDEAPFSYECWTDPALEID